jgi:uncharacterized protein YndB with AHSA1/START domain
MSETVAIAPVQKSIHVPCSVQLAFEVFTRETASWWPVREHSLHGEDVREIVFEGHAGGSVYEVTRDGERGHWATVLAWEPPGRLVLSWEVNPARAATELELRFTADGDGTRVDLEHRHWERLEDEARSVRDNYDAGWDVVLDAYAARLEP